MGSEPRRTAWMTYAAVVMATGTAHAQPATAPPAMPAPSGSAPAADGSTAAPTASGDAPAPEATPARPVAASTTPTPAPPMEIPRVRWPAPRPYKAMVAFEVGLGRTGDTDQLYGNGAGRTVVLGVTNVEFRLLESYDLDDRSGGMYDAAGGHGRLGITSVGYRTLLSAGRLSVRPLVGVAWVRRTSLRYDELATFGGFDHETLSQHGLAAMVGGGVGIRLGLLDVSVDARAYPTWWASIGGDRAVIRGGAVVFEPITNSPGGIPVTLTAALAIGY